MKVRFNVKRYFQVLGISLAVVIAAAAICMGMDFTGMMGQEPVDNTSTVKAEDGKINVLLMGTDVDGLRTDAIMLVSYDTSTSDVNILTVPRDTRMYIGNRYQKINAAHAFVDKSGEIGGPTATCEAVTRITGIPINYYVDFSFDAVAHVINELGPIDFTVPDLYGDGVGMVYDDPVQSLHINLPPGDYQLTGQQAVWVMRYRHGNYDPSINGFKGYTNGDTDRTEMQQKLIKAIVDQKVNASLILKIPAIFKEVSSEIKTNFSINDIIKYSKYLSGFSSANIHSYMLPGEYGHDSSNGDVWVPDMDAIQEMTRNVFGYSADYITTDNPDNPTGEYSEGSRPSSNGTSSGASGTSKSTSGTASNNSGSPASVSGNSSGGSSSQNENSQSQSSVSPANSDSDTNETDADTESDTTGGSSNNGEIDFDSEISGTEYGDDNNYVGSHDEEM